MKRAIKKHQKDFVSILGLVLISVVVAGYIAIHERLRFPFISPPEYSIKAEFTTAKSVTPGQGQTVNISGVKVGEITGVSVKQGMALVVMKIDQKYRSIIHQDATAFLRPRSGLEDMLVELSPGPPGDPTPVAKSGFTIPVSHTLPTVEADEVLSSLDTDTRAYLDLLVNGAGTGLKDQGGSRLAQVLERFEPTHRDLARLQGALSQRRLALRNLVHSLRVLNAALAKKQTQIVSLVDASAKVFGAFAAEGSHISRAVADLPGTLSQTTNTLLKVRTFANALGPASVNLLPAAQNMPGANAAVAALAKPSTPIIRDQVRPFVRTAQPVVNELRPVAVNLAAATPQLASSFAVLNHLFNMLGYYPGGQQHGYLWWLAWLDHNARTLFSQQDANGVFRPLFLQFTCNQVGLLFNGGQGTPLGPVLGAVARVFGQVQGQATPESNACQTAGYKPGFGLPGLPGLPKGLSQVKPAKASAAAKARAAAPATASKSHAAAPATSTSHAAAPATTSTPPAAAPSASASSPTSTNAG